MFKKYCLAVVSILLTSFCFSLYAKTKNVPENLPILTPENQHAISSKRITAQLIRGHYKKININRELSAEVFDRYIKHLDYARNVFLASDIEKFTKYRENFDRVVARGKLDLAYDIYNLNLKRRLERYQYALSLLEKESGFNFELDDSFDFDREGAKRPETVTELNDLWYKKVKYDALNLMLAGKKWPKIQEVLGKRYRYAIKRLKQTESEDVFQTLMNSFARVVEPHTSYLSPRNAERFEMEMNLSLEGIGAVLRTEEDYTVIQSVVSGGPADKSNQLKPKDRIVGVAQANDEFEDVIGWRLDDVVELIKGPKGTKVRLQVLGPTDDTAIKIVAMTRDKIKLEDRAAKSEVYYQEDGNKQSKKLGVITIPGFYHNLSKDVKLEIEKLKDENVEGIIVDLRGNGGGSLNEARLLTGLFIDKGPVVQVRYVSDRIYVEQDTDGITYYNGPLTVLVDRYSASASEIFSAAIQDYGRGIIIGEHTFGKGTVQQHRRLGRKYDLFKHDLGNLQFTIAKFYRINGGSTQHRGVIPDISFPTAIDPADWGESKEENALPWDSIDKANYRQLHDRANDIAYLTSLYKSRIVNNREFNYLLTDIAEYNVEKNDKTISLNITKRKAKREKRTEKQLKRANERLKAMNKEPVKSLDDLNDEFDDLDPFLKESANITFDLVELTKIAKQ